MKHSRKIHKAIAIFFLVNFGVQILAPTVSYALTAGPTAPEFSSFEPVDTTDMVNLATGEFIYNNPIIEIPGPEGGYPLSLSYHAGIKLDQEASWVGLGFTLNPGAINRTVNKFADDNNNVKREVKDYWGGGTQVTKAYSIGLGIPKTGISINYSMAETQDTYKGFSSNSALGISFDPVSFGLSNSYSRGLANNQGATDRAARESMGIRFASMTRVQNLVGGTSMGFSIGTQGVKTNLSIAGHSLLSEKNNSAGRISSINTKDIESGGSISVFSLGLKELHTRYFSDETQGLYTFGALYPGEANKKIDSDFYETDWRGQFINYDFDCYDIPDNLPFDISLVSRRGTVNNPNDPSQQLGGTLPAYDNFTVLGQGIGGVMQPFIFENGDLYGQSIYERGLSGEPSLGYPTLYYQSLKKFSDKKVDFRFLNDFSNALTIAPSQFISTGTSTTDWSSDNNWSVDQHSISALSDGFNNVDKNQKLAGSKHIEWFSNEEITSGRAKSLGFVDFYVNRFDRKLDFDIYENYMQPEATLPYSDFFTRGKGYGSFTTDQYKDTDIYADFGSAYKSLKSKKSNLRSKIGGFKITNETGVSYHYALPVYSYNEYTRSKMKDPRKGTSTFREYKNDEPYAYTWLLTGVTGPDYVDRNNNGVIDDNDFGYWVKFDYGRWADSYQWRTPHTGYSDDIESEYAVFSYGIKELYYLDAIETRSHKAIFIKSKKLDGRGVTSRLEGGSNPRLFKMEYKTSKNSDHFGTIEFKVSPVSTMKLDAIYLFEKSALSKIPFSKARGEKYREATTSNPISYPYRGSPYTYDIPFSKTNEKITIKEQEDYIKIKYHNGDLVYDDDDIHDLPQFKENALRIIQFETDYSLSKEVPNSVGLFSSASSGGCSNLGVSECEDVEKRIGNDYEWPSNFGRGCYSRFVPQDIPVCCLDNQKFYSEANVFVGYYNYGNACLAAAGQYLGNDIQYHRTGKLTLKGIKTLGKGGADLIPSTTFTYGENPEYVYGKYDEWGYYKSDFDPMLINGSRRITPVSAQSVKAWSLQSITTGLGAKIKLEYEPNQYAKSVYNDFSVFSVERLEPTDGDELLVYFKEKGLNLSNWFSVGNTANLSALIVSQLQQNGPPDLIDIVIEYLGMPPRDRIKYNPVSDIYLSTSDDKILEVGSDVIKISSSRLKEILTRTTYPITRSRRGEPPTTINYPCIPYFISGFLKAQDPNLKYAGGIRVQSISLEDGLNTNKTHYEYINPLSPSISSGQTSFKPFNYPSNEYPKDVEMFDEILSGNNMLSERNRLLNYQMSFQQVINEPFLKIMAFSREAPAPGALYEFVTVKNSVNNTLLDNYTIHHFKVFDENMIVREVVNNFIGDSRLRLDLRQITIKNNAIDAGNPKGVKTLSSNGNLLKSISYNYLYDENIEDFERKSMDSKQGITQQSFHKFISLREYSIDVSYGNWWEVTFGLKNNVNVTSKITYQHNKGLVTSRHDRSNVLTSISEIDHKKGISSTVRHHEFDFYSGQSLKTITTDSYGNSFLKVTEPAYKYYPSMGLKIYTPNNKHMLSQAATSSEYTLGNDNIPIGLLSASIQTWSDQIPVLGLSTPQSGIWRKHSSYRWDGKQPIDDVTGTYPIAEWLIDGKLKVPFNWSDPQNNLNWQKESEITLYNTYSNGLEATDINGNFAATKMDPRHVHVIASTSNSSYNEMAYSGMEFSAGNTMDEGGVSRGDGNASSLKAHTGKYSLLLGSNRKGFSFILKAGKVDLSKKYRASVWLYAPNEGETQPELNKAQLYYSINGIEKEAHPILQKSKSKSWYLINIDIVPNGNNDILVGVKNNSSRGVFFDDFRVHPIDASMSSYVYDPLSGEVTYIIDANNLYSRFEYDAMGRLVRSTREQMNFDFGDGKESFKADKITGETIYNYGKKN
jgi:hypothetical protein